MDNLTRSNTGTEKKKRLHCNGGFGSQPEDGLCFRESQARYSEGAGSSVFSGEVPREDKTDTGKKQRHTKNKQLMIF